MIVLASASPRRLELLTAAGIDCVVDPADVDERPRAGEDPRDHVERLACDKARAVAARHAGAIVLGADTVVVVDGEILGKPAGDEDARAMLRRLSGRSHDVLTGVAVVRGGTVDARVERTVVWFHPLTDRQIAWYVGTGECRDKAGAYGIQGGAARFIPRIEGSYSNVVGLPVATVAEMLRI